MSTDPRYIPLFELEEVLFDKLTGQPLSAGVVNFWEDQQRTTPKEVFRISGTSPNYTFVSLGAQLTLSNIGTFVDGSDTPIVVYAYPFAADGVTVEKYYVTVESALGAPQFVRENVPYVAPSVDPEGDLARTENQIANPQFVEVLFNPDNVLSLAVSGSGTVTPIAPDWDLVTSGSGTVTIQRVAPISSIVTQPPYVLNINSSGGVSSLAIRQRLTQSPRLFAGGNVYGSFVARGFGGGTPVLTMTYTKSTGGVVTIAQGAVRNDGTFATIHGAETVSANNTDPATTGYVDISLVIPVNTQVEVTSFMLVPVDSDVTDLVEVIYPQESTARQIDHLFHYYKPQLEFKPISNLLTGWDFPLNPAQRGTGFTVTQPANTGQGEYTWDQTICGRSGANFTVARNTVYGGFQFTSTAANTSLYMMQYLSGEQAKKLIGTSLSVNVFGFSANASNVTMRVYLFRAPSTAAFPTLPNALGTMTTSGLFTLTAANWTLIPRSSLDTATATLAHATSGAVVRSDSVDYGFSGWEIVTESEIANTDKFAVVVTFFMPTSGTECVMNSISVVPGDIPTRPAPQTPDEVLRECQFYFENSKNLNVLITANGVESALYRQQSVVQIGGANLQLWPRSFGIEYNTVKRSAPVVTLYAENGTINNVTGYIYSEGVQINTGNIASTNWTQSSNGNKAIQFLSNYVNNAAGFISFGHLIGNTSEAFISFHYQADARIGI